VWTWARDRRFPELASWFNKQVADGLVLVCDAVVLELIRLTPNESRAQKVTGHLDAFEFVAMGAQLWKRARELQSLLSANGDHRRVPPIDLLIGAAAERADVRLVHYDRDYERLAQVLQRPRRFSASARVQHLRYMRYTPSSSSSQTPHLHTTRWHPRHLNRLTRPLRKPA
jgi:predicted nucleic acid-binding protein